MFTAIIENEGNTLVMESPCKRYLMPITSVPSASESRHMKSSAWMNRKLYKMHWDEQYIGI